MTRASKSSSPWTPNEYFHHTKRVEFHVVAALYLSLLWQRCISPSMPPQLRPLWCPALVLSERAKRRRQSRTRRISEIMERRGVQSQHDDWRLVEGLF
jgi:hypothetical protein